MLCKCLQLYLMQITLTEIITKVITNGSFWMFLQ